MQERFASVFISKKTGEIEKIEYDGTDEYCQRFHDVFMKFLEDGGIEMKTIEFESHEDLQQVKTREDIHTT